MQDMHRAVALQELAEGCTGDAVLIRTVYDNLVLFVERLQRLTGGGEMEGTRDMLGQVGPTHSLPSLGGRRPGGPTSAVPSSCPIVLTRLSFPALPCPHQPHSPPP